MKKKAANKNEHALPWYLITNVIQSMCTHAQANTQNCINKQGKKSLIKIYWNYI